MSRHLARPVNVTSVKHDLAAAFSEVFRLAWTNQPGGDPRNQRFGDALGICSSIA
jgi:hypothetical protein